MERLKSIVVPLIVVVFVVVAAVTVFGGGTTQKTLTAYFPRTVSLYEGSDVRVLGVAVGRVTKVEPNGTNVKVEMSYDADVKVPSDVEAMIVSPAIVGDRYIELSPVYKSGEEIEDGATIDENSTEVPLELDQIYSSLDTLTVALGPDGANSQGALSDLLEVTAQNFKGQGLKFHETIQDFAKLSTTLDNNKEELFGSAAELQKFITKLAENDTTVRRFNDSLGQVSTVLAGEREELAASLKNLAVALDQVGSFVAENREVLGQNIRGLNRVAKVLVKQRSNLDEVLRVAPLALNNVQLTYNPDTGTLDTNANIGNLVDEISSDPAAVLCALVSANDTDGSACDLIQSLPLPRATPFGPGTGSSAGDVYDPTLGGLVKVRGQ